MHVNSSDDAIEASRARDERLLRVIPLSWSRRLAWGFFGLFVVATIVEVPLLASTEEDFTPIDSLIFPLVDGTFAFVGVLLATRRPHNPLGWLFLAIGTGATFANVAQAYASLAIVESPGVWPGGIWAAWYGALAWPCSMALLLFVPLLFPDGKPARRWLKPFLWGGIVAWSAMLISFAFAPGPLDVGTKEHPMINPLGIEPLGSAITAIQFLIFLLPLMLVMGLISLVLRAIRSGGVERQQLKWLAFGTAGFGFFAFLIEPLLRLMLTDPAMARIESIGNVLFGVAVMLLPISMGVAITRYHLYDLGRIVNRAAVYVVLTAVLAGVYLMGVAALHSVLSPIAGESDIAVAASTLAVAALFRPLRRRIQAFIDHRFYRRKYDADRTIDDFSSRLRDEIDLGTLNDELVGVVHQTVHPTHVSVWLRPTQ